jgi:hypothetical protein
MGSCLFGSHNFIIALVKINATSSCRFTLKALKSVHPTYSLRIHGLFSGEKDKTRQKHKVISVHGVYVCTACKANH